MVAGAVVGVFRRFLLWLRDGLKRRTIRHVFRAPPPPHNIRDMSSPAQEEGCPAPPQQFYSRRHSFKTTPPRRPLLLLGTQTTCITAASVGRRPCSLLLACGRGCGQCHFVVCSLLSSSNCGQVSLCTSSALTGNSCVLDDFSICQALHNHSAVCQETGGCIYAGNMCYPNVTSERQCFTVSSPQLNINIVCVMRGRAGAKSLCLTR